MKLSERLWFRIIIDTLHDLSGGAWIGGVYVLWVVRAGAKTVLAPDVFTQLQRTWSWILLFLLVTLSIQVATGIVRVSHWTTHLHPDALSQKRRAAWIKHGVFITLFVVAMVEVFLILAP